MAKVTTWYGTDEPDYFFNKNSSTSQITLISSYAGDDTLLNVESGVWIDAGTDNNNVSLAATGGDTVIAQSGNDTLNVATADGARYYNLINMGDGDNYINNSTILHSTISAGSGNDTIKTGGYYASISTGDGDNLVSITTSNDNNTVITGKGNDTILGNASDNLFVYAGGNDFLGESATGSSISLAANGASNLTDISGIVYDSIGTAVLTFDNDAGTLSLQNAAGMTFVINGSARIFGENVMYFSDQNSVTLTAAYSGEIDASQYTNFDASALDWQVVLLGNMLSNNLHGGKNNDSLWGNAGNDTLNGKAGDDTLTGGTGNDLFIYSAGNDVTTDYEVGDKISLGAAISKSTFDGTERTIIGGAYVATDSTAAKVTLKSGIIVGDALDNSILGGSGKDTLWGKDGDDFINGNAGNDKLYGQNGNDTLWGGIGNDTLKGGSGADTFIYSAGNDVIADFDDDDLLQISGDWTATYSESKNAIAFKVGSTASAITLKNFTATTFNVNGTVYQISGGEFVKK